MSNTPSITRGLLPDISMDEVDFVESSFFSSPESKLPSPDTIINSPNLIRMFPEMKLVVKFGPSVSIDEAVTMWAIRKCFRASIPVPELFGWRVFKGTVFIYMALIPGVTLQERWSDPHFSPSDKSSLCEQLNQMIASLRQLKHEPGDSFIGSISRGPLPDRVFEELPKTGPFDDLEQFYHFLEWLPQRFLSPSQRFKDPYLDLMPKDSPITFTHADIHPTNIIVSDTGPPRVVALIDWGQSGWYPDYWEYYKMCYTVHWETEWRKEWFPKIIEPREDEQYLMAEYSMSIGAV